MICVVYDFVFSLMFCDVMILCLCIVSCYALCLFRLVYFVVCLLG